jgi:ParB-like chromosome segregation protein Spo0J
VELERRTTAPAHATGAVEFVPLEAISEDATFRLRDEGDVSSLASSIGRLGQLVPVELRPLPGAVEGGEGPRFQVVAGFRRLAALRMLARERVLARVHETLEDDDARALALALALVTEPLLASELQALRERLQATGEAPWADEALEEALARAPVDPRLRERFVAWLERPDEAEAEPEPGEAAEEVAAAPAAEVEGPVEVTPDELADDLAARMFEVNQDLSLAYESWAELPPEGRRMIVEQARYVAELLRLLERDE